jgi:tartrate-resistant acid phosphatase type 5
MKLAQKTWLKSRKLWWSVLLAFCFTLLLFVYLAIPSKVISHEIMGKLEDSREVRLLFVGDTGTGNSNQRAVAQLLEDLCNTVQPAGVVLLGDNFYQVGVTSVRDPLWQERFEDIYSGECLKKINFYSILGNHDHRTSPNAQIEYSEEVSTRWVMPARYYMLRFGDILEIGALDTSVPDRCGLASLCSLDWVTERLKKSSTAWKILIGHHPILSGGKYKTLSWFRRLVLPEVYCRSGASAYISGHDHSLQHLHGRPSGASCEIEQFVSGAGGADLYPADVIADRTLYAESAHGVLLGRFTPHEQRYEFFKVGSLRAQYLWSRLKED